MSASSWFGIGFLIFAILLLIIGLILAIYSERQYSGISSWPLYQGFATIGGKPIKLSCPAGKKMTLQRAVYGPYGSGTNCANCENIDVTSDLKSQIDGQNSTTITDVPTTGIWGTQRSCPAGQSCGAYVLSGSLSCA